MHVSSPTSSRNPKLQILVKFDALDHSAAIWDHINKSGHAASVEDFSDLDRAKNDFDLLIHESLLILRDRPSHNSQQSSIPLALF